MAFERIGLGGFLKFDERTAVRGMENARRGFARLRRGAGQVSACRAMIVGGMRNTALALAPITAGLGFGLAKAASFDKQMSAVGAITRASTEDLEKLTAEAKRQGIVSVFSASESAEAMEFLGRASFTTDQIIEGLGGVMAAAAAEGIDLATSADIIAQSVKIMGLEASDAGKNADILALASAKSNTNIVELGQALSLSGLVASEAGLSMAELTAVFGKLADAGLKSTRGGTSFSNMLDRLTKTGPKATKIMGDLGIKFRDDITGRLFKIPKLIDNFRKGLSKLGNEGERNAAIAEIFGIRGSRAYLALAAAGGDALAALTKDLEKSSEGLGAAQIAAEARLNNLLGAVKLFASSAEAATIEFFGPFLGIFKDTVKDLTSGLNSVLFAIQALKKGVDTIEIDEKQGETARLIAQGILDAIGTIRSAFDSLVARIREVGKSLEESIGKERLRQFVKLATISLVVAGALAPVLIGLVGMAFLLKAVVGIFVGLGQVALGAFSIIMVAAKILIGGFEILVGIVQSFMFLWPLIKLIALQALTAIAPAILPILAVMALLTGAFLLFRNEGESVGETFARMWRGIERLALKVFNDTIGPLIDGFVQGFFIATGGITAIWTSFITTVSSAWRSLTSELGILFNEVFAEFSATFAEIKSVFDTIMREIFGQALGTTDGMADSFRDFGTIVGFVAGFLLDAFQSTFGQIIKLTFAFVKLAAKVLITPFRTMVGVVRDVIQGIKLLFKGDFIGFFSKVGQAITRVLTLPFQVLMQGILAALSILPKNIISRFIDPSALSQLEQFAKTGFAPAVEVTRPRAQILEGPTARGENVIAASNALQKVAQTRRQEAERQEKAAEKKTEVNVTAVAGDTNVTSKLVCDGVTLAEITGKAEQTAFERNGAINEPFLRGVVAQTGTRIRGNSRSG